MRLYYLATQKYGLMALRRRRLKIVRIADLNDPKFTAWRYESEYRAICRLSDSISAGGLYFEPFSEALQLAQVIVGDRSTVSRSQLAKALGNDQGHVERFKARPAFKTFAVVRNRDAGLWI